MFKCITYELNRDFCAYLQDGHSHSLRRVKNKGINSYIFSLHFSHSFRYTFSFINSNHSTTPIISYLDTGDCVSQKTWHFYRTTVTQENVLHFLRGDPAVLLDRSQWIKLRKFQTFSFIHGFTIKTISRYIKQYVNAQTVIILRIYPKGIPPRKF